MQQVRQNVIQKAPQRSVHPSVATMFRFNDAPDKPIVNLAYANGFPPQTYQLALAPLFERYQVVSLTMPPLRVDSRPETFTRWSQYGDDMLAGLDSLTDQPVIGIGHSYSGVALSYAAIKRPDKFSKIILIDPTYMPPHFLLLAALMKMQNSFRPSLVTGALRRRRDFADTEAAYQYFKGKKLFATWPDENIHAYAESMTAMGSDGQAHLVWAPEWEAHIYSTIATNVWTLPQRLTTPAIIIRGETTDVFGHTSSLMFHWLNPRVPIITIAGAGHLVPQEKPVEVGAAIAQFVG